MRRVESVYDEMNGVVTYELDDGRFVQLDRRTIEMYGLASVLRAHHIEAPDASKRVAVFQHGKQVGSLPGDFDPLFVKSTNWLYDPRPSDFRRVSDHWEAAWTLGPGDIESVPGFVWNRNK